MTDTTAKEHSETPERRGRKAFLLSIRMKFVMLMTAFGLVAYIAISNFWFPRVNTILTETQNNLVNQQLDILSDSLLPFLIQNQFAGIYETLDSLQRRHPDWARVVLYSADGTRLYPLGEPPMVAGDTILRQSKDIEFQGRYFGKLDIGYDISAEARRLAEEQRKIQYVLLGLFTFAVLVILLALDRMIGNRIRMLVIAARRLASGDFKATLPDASHDEIGWLSESFDAMRQQIFEKESSLVEARRQAESAAVAKSQFLATMSHEIRTPLNGVIPVADLLYQSELNHQQKTFVQTIQTSARALKSIIDDVLDLSKLEVGELRLRERAFDMHELVQNVQDMLLIRAQNSNLQLILNADMDSRGWYFGDDDRIRQVLINLVGNAIKFTQKGSVTIHTQNHKRGDGMNDFTVSVTDTGIGISKDQQKHIFQRFAQVDSSNTRSVEGTGLGLSICEAIMDTMGGTIGVDSVEGKGSTFWVKFTLPDAVPAQSAKEKEAKSEIKAPRGKLKILVVDDNQINLMITSEIIRSCGHEAFIVDGGAKAIDMVQQDAFDLVLMDVQMPQIDGLSTTKTIRDLNSEASAVKIAGYSASAFDEDRQRCIDSGMDSFLSKPLTRDKLLEVFDELDL